MKRVGYFVNGMMLSVLVAYVALTFVEDDWSSPIRWAARALMVVAITFVFWFKTKGLQKIQGRMMLAEHDLPRNKKPPNRFWYWLLRDWIKARRLREAGEEEN